MFVAPRAGFHQPVLKIPEFVSDPAPPQPHLIGSKSDNPGSPSPSLSSPS
jgi:hypothetical protein